MHTMLTGTEAMVLGDYNSGNGPYLLCPATDGIAQYTQHTHFQPGVDNIWRNSK